MSEEMAFTNGLSNNHADEIDNVILDLTRINWRIAALGRHRSYALAQTKIEEAMHWMRDRTHKPATGG
jgi:hypothetical protein